MTIKTTHTRMVSTVILLSGLASLVGCQSWSSTGYSPARVPPPGTGTFQPPGNYYNNAAPAGGQVSQVGTGVGQVASFNTPQNSGGFGPQAGGVQTAGFQGVSNAGVQPAQYSASTSSPSIPGGFTSANPLPSNTGMPVNQQFGTQQFVPAGNPAPPPAGSASFTTQVSPNGGTFQSSGQMRATDMSGSSATLSDNAEPPSLQWQP